MAPSLYQKMKRNYNEEAGQYEVTASDDSQAVTGCAIFLAIWFFITCISLACSIQQKDENLQSIVINDLNYMDELERDNAELSKGLVSLAAESKAQRTELEAKLTAEATQREQEIEQARRLSNSAQVEKLEKEKNAQIAELKEQIQAHKHVEQEMSAMRAELLKNNVDNGETVEKIFERLNTMSETKVIHNFTQGTAEIHHHYHALKTYRRNYTKWAGVMAFFIVLFLIVCSALVHNSLSFEVHETVLRSVFILFTLAFVLAFFYLGSYFKNSRQCMTMYPSKNTCNEAIFKDLLPVVISLIGLGITCFALFYDTPEIFDNFPISGGEHKVFHLLSVILYCGFLGFMFNRVTLGKNRGGAGGAIAIGLFFGLFLALVLHLFHSDFMQDGNLLADTFNIDISGTVVFAILAFLAFVAICVTICLPFINSTSWYVPSHFGKAILIVLALLLLAGALVSYYVNKADFSTSMVGEFHAVFGEQEYHFLIPVVMNILIMCLLASLGRMWYRGY